MNWAMEHENNGYISQQPKFDLSWNETGMLEVSSFSTLFPQYREKYLQEVWPTVKSSLKVMTVSTTRKTRDPYSLIKARDLIKLLSRSFPVHQGIKILDNEMQCVIGFIGYYYSFENQHSRKHRFLELGACFDEKQFRGATLTTRSGLLIEDNTISRRSKQRIPQKTKEKEKLHLFPQRKKAMEFGKQKSVENIEAESYIAAAGVGDFKKEIQGCRI
nr:krr1 small subunit processome component like [Quercus suber]